MRKPEGKDPVKLEEGQPRESEVSRLEDEGGITRDEAAENVPDAAAKDAIKRPRRDLPER